MRVAWRGSTHKSSHLEDYWPCAGGLSTAKAIGRYNSGTYPITVDGSDGYRSGRWDIERSGIRR